MNMSDDSRTRALLLHYVGKDVNDIFETLQDHGHENDFKKACDTLTKYFTLKRNISFEIFKFRNMKPGKGETIDEFHALLQIVAM